MFKIVHGLVAVPTTSLISAVHALDATTSISSNVSWHQQLHTEILFSPEQSPSGTTLTKNLPKRLPSTASRVACISPPSTFVDVIPHIGSLSTMFQFQSRELTDTVHRLLSARHCTVHIL